MSRTLGSVTAQGCYKGDKRISNAKFLHNCTTAGGNNVQWTFEVFEDGVLIGHVIAALSNSFKGNEAAQKAQLIKIAEALIAEEKIAMVAIK